MEMGNGQWTMENGQWKWRMGFLLIGRMGIKEISRKRRGSRLMDGWGNRGLYFLNSTAAFSTGRAAL